MNIYHFYTNFQGPNPLSKHYNSVFTEANAENRVHTVNLSKSEPIRLMSRLWFDIDCDFVMNANIAVLQYLDLI